MLRHSTARRSFTAALDCNPRAILVDVCCISGPCSWRAWVQRSLTVTRCVCVYVKEHKRERGRQRHCFREVLLFSPLNTHSASFTSVLESWHHSASDSSACHQSVLQHPEPTLQGHEGGPPARACCLAGLLTGPMSGFQAEQQAPADLRRLRAGSGDEEETQGA